MSSCDEPHPAIDMFVKSPALFFEGVRFMLDMGEPPEATLPEPRRDADLAMIRDLVAIEREMAQPSPSAYVLRNVDRLRSDAVSRGNAMVPEPAASASAVGVPPITSKPDVSADRLLGLLETQTALLSRLVEGQPATTSQAAPPQDSTRTIPTFSEAAEAYLADRTAAKGGKETADIKSIRRRAEVFIAIVGDKRIDQLQHEDFQTFLNGLQYWPPDPENCEELKKLSVRQILELNKERDHAFGILARKTVIHHYLVEMKTILGKAVIVSKIADPIPKFRLTIPTIFKATQKRQAPTMSRMPAALRAGIETGELDRAMLAPFGMMTGRRLAPLVYMRGSHFRRVDGFTIVRIPQHIVDPVTGAVTVVPIKTTESLTGFILNRFFDDIGFTDFAMSLGDEYLFPSRLTCADPADAAQKAINGLLEPTGGTFHGLRHWFITLMRNSGVSDYSNRVQVGHATLDEHQSYGELPVQPKDAQIIQNLRMPDEVDLSMFYGLDFPRMRQAWLSVE